MILALSGISLVDVGLILAAAMLIFTSYLDLKKREVEDKVWVIFGAVGVVLQALELWYGIVSGIWLAISIILAATIGMGLYFFGFYGGADGKALIVLSILVPVFVPQHGIYSIAPLMVLSNGVLISVLLPFAMLLLNSLRILRGEKIFDGFNESGLRKFAACMLGYKQLGNPRPFQFSMEKVSESGKKFDFTMLQDDFETRAGTWVTPGIPLLVFFAIGFFVMILYGDLVISLIRFVFAVL